MDGITVQIFLSAASAFFAGVAAWGSSRMKARAEQHEQIATQKAQEWDAVKEGIQSILRDRIITAYNHYVSKGCLPIYAMDNVRHMYTAYHALGGNGTITRLFTEMMKLPQEEGEKHD